MYCQSSNFVFLLSSSDKELNKLERNNLILFFFPVLLLTDLIIAKNGLCCSYWKSKFVFQYCKMKTFKIVPLSEEYARQIRSSRRDAFNHEIVEQIATGLGPCRVSLQPFQPGKDIRILFSHSPFEIDNAYNQSGPVFIQKEEVEAL
jgi:hypothetical protein